MSNVKPKHWFTIGAGVVLVFGAVLIYKSSVFSSNDEYVKISAIVLFGLGLTVALMAILAIIYSFLKLDDPTKALGLPDGSIRALLAFSLVLIFICLATFLYSSIDKAECQNCGKTLSRVTDAQLSDLRNNFVVAAELARDNNGNLIYEQTLAPNEPGIENEVRHPLYSVTYYPKRNPDASDFAKQIFTTLATVFVSVVSFYFGSSVTSSAMAVGAKTAKSGPPSGEDGTPQSQAPQPNQPALAPHASDASSSQ